jgi:competence protein ComEA
MKKSILLLGALLAHAGLALAVVNINSATKDQLQELHGIGATKAQAIIDYRQKNGPFKSVDDIKKVDGIGDATLQQIRKELVLSGRTTGVGKPAEAVRAVTPQEKASEAKVAKAAADEKAAKAAKANANAKPPSPDSQPAEKKPAPAPSAPAKKVDDKKPDAKKPDDNKK